MKPDIIGVVFNHRSAPAKKLAHEMVKRFNLSDRSWTISTLDMDAAPSELRRTDMVITVGGDGTIIRAARLTVPLGIPILGINMGRLGFMTELQGDEAMGRLPDYLEGAGRIEERSMVRVDFIPPEKGEDRPHRPIDGFNYHALNDVVVGRGGVARLVTIKAYIDGAHLTDFRSDAVMVATATGSTGYNLSVGGPMLWPTAGVMILKAVAPHVGIAPALVLPPTAVVDLTIETDHEATLSVDGYVDLELAQGDGIRVQRSPNKTKFLRALPPNAFYQSLTQRLGFGGGQSSTRAIQY